MSCALTQGRKDPCHDVVGGLKALYFCDFEAVDLTEADNAVSAVVKSSDGTTKLDAFKYELDGASQLTSPITAGRDNGTTFFNQTLELQLKKLDKDTQNEIKVLAYSKPLIFAQDRNDNLWLCGVKRGMRVTGGNIMTGAADGDRPGYDLTFEAPEKEPPKFVSAAPTAADLFASVTEGTNT